MSKLNSVFDIADYLRKLDARAHGILFSVDVEAFPPNTEGECAASVEVYSGDGSVGLAIHQGADYIVFSLTPAVACALAVALMEGCDHA